MYVILKDNEWFLCNPRWGKTYSQKLQHAKIFKSLEAAQRECCEENERVIPLEHFLNLED